MRLWTNFGKLQTSNSDSGRGEGVDNASGIALGRT